METGEKLGEILRENAGGTFLWVSVILLLLKQPPDPISKSRVDALTAETHLPTEIFELYEKCLSNIPKDEREEACRALQTLQANARPLLLEELAHMLAVHSTDLRLSDIEMREEIFIAQSIASLLGPLVKTTGGVISLIHQTLTFFLGRPQSASVNVDTKFFPEAEHNIHFEIAQSCMRYLLLPDMALDDSYTYTEAPLTGQYDTECSPNRDDFGPLDLMEPEWDELDLPVLFKDTSDLSAERLCSIAEQCKLFEYAARYWSYHYLRCQEKEQKGLESLAVNLIGFKTHHAWLDYLKTVDQDVENFPESHDALVLASFFGLSGIFQRLLVSPGPKLDAGQAAFWAAARGHHHCLEKILLQYRIDVDSTYWRSISPLAIAATNGHQACVNISLGSRMFSINGRTNKVRTPLSLGAGAGHEQIMARLLKEDGIDVNAADCNGAPPVFWAAASSQCFVLKLLPNHPSIDMSIRDFRKHNALSWARMYGCAQTTEALLRDGRCDLNVQNHAGKTPLMLAVVSEDLATVQAVTQHNDVDLALRDHEGRTAISWAAQSPDIRILECLLLRGGQDADTRDIHGWSPLAWTLDPPARLENARLLLRYASKEINEPDEFGTPLVALAITLGNVAVAELLISSDKIDIERRNSRGRHPLFHAITRGHTDPVRQLLDRNPTLADIPDDAGLTPTALAATLGNSDICDALTQKRGSHTTR